MCITLNGNPYMTHDDTEKNFKRLRSHILYVLLYINLIGYRIRVSNFGLK